MLTQLAVLFEPGRWVLGKQALQPCLSSLSGPTPAPDEWALHSSHCPRGPLPAHAQSCYSGRQKVAISLAQQAAPFPAPGHSSQMRAHLNMPDADAETGSGFRQGKLRTSQYSVQLLRHLPPQSPAHAWNLTPRPSSSSSSRSRRHSRHSQIRSQPQKRLATSSSSHCLAPCQA